MDLILHFNRKSLNEIKKHLRKLTRDNLNFIELVDFCGAIMRKLICDHAHRNQALTTPEGREVVLRTICGVFFAVDVDFRCAITWQDFSAYCLRLIRNRFAMSVRQSPMQYIQSGTNGPIVPAARMYYCSASGRLYIFDSETPTLRVIGRNLRYDGNKFNPCVGVVRYLHMYCLENTNKKIKGKVGTKGGAQVSNVWKNKMPSPDKGAILSMQYISRTNQFALTTSDNFVSYWNLDLSRLIGFERMDRPQVGLCYSHEAEMLVGWGCSGGETSFFVMNPVQRITKYKVRVHKEYVLHACEVRAHGCMVSCSIDRSVCIWPTKFIKTRANAFVDKYEMSTINQYTDAEVAGEVRYFKGNTFAIKSLAYAADNDLVIGVGFDFDMYAWDPTTAIMMMNLVGHSAPILSVHVVHTPIERVLSCDESGTIKMWNIDRSLGHTAEQLQNIQLVCSNASKTLALVPAFQGGSTLAALADRLYFLHGVSTAADDIRPVPGGLGVSHGNNQLWLICRGTFACSKLSNGMFTERLEFHNADRTDTTEVSKSSVNVMRAMVSRSGEGKGNAPTSVTGSLISPTDEITAVTTDQMGKKIFVGTIEGHVFMFDGHTFGLLRRLTSPVHHQDEMVHQQTAQSQKKKAGGAHSHRSKQQLNVISSAVPFVASLCYITHEELLIATFSNHAIKIFAGCYRVLTVDQPRKFALNDFTGSAMNGIFNQSAIGGNAPHSPLLLRECRYQCYPFVPLPSMQSHAQAQGVTLRGDTSVDDVSNDDSERHDVFAKEEGGLMVSNDSIVLCAAVSEDFHLVAVSSDDGCVRIYNFLDLRMLAVLMAPKVRRPKPASLTRADHMEMEVEMAVCSVISFVPRMPVLVGADNYGRLTMWSTKPLACMWILTWSASVVSRGGASDAKKEGVAGVKGQKEAVPSYAAETSDRKSRDRENCPTSHPLTALSCIGWVSEKHGEQSRKMSVVNAKEVFRKMIVKRKESRAHDGESTRRALSQLHRDENETNHVHGMHSAHGHSTKLIYVDMNQSHTNELKSPPSAESRRGPGRRSGVGMGGLTGLTKAIKAAKSNFWCVIVGDSEGRVYTHDISKVLIRSGIFQEVENYNSRKLSSAPIFPYGQGKKYHLYESLDIKSCEEVSNMLSRPVGSMQATLKVGYQGTAPTDVTVRNFYNFQGAGAVRNILPMQAPNKTELRAKPLLKPESMFLSTVTSVVKLFDWEGYCLGEVSDGVMATVDLDAELINKRMREKQEYQDKVDALELEKVNYRKYLEALKEYEKIQEEKKKKAALVGEKDQGVGRRGKSKTKKPEHEPTAAEIIKQSKSVAPTVQKPPADSVPVPNPSCGIINGFGWDFPKITGVHDNVAESMMNHLRSRVDDVIYDKAEHMLGTVPQDEAEAEAVEDRALAEGFDQLHESLSTVAGEGSLLLVGDAKEVKLELDTSVTVEEADAKPALGSPGLHSAIPEQSEYSWTKTLRAMDEPVAGATATVGVSDNRHGHDEGHGHPGLTLHLREGSSMEVASTDAGGLLRDPTERLWDSLSAKAAVEKFEADKAQAAVLHTGPFAAVAASPQSFCNGIVQLRNFQVEMDARDSLANVKQKKTRAMDAMLQEVYDRKERADQKDRERRERREAEADRRRDAELALLCDEERAEYLLREEDGQGGRASPTRRRPTSAPAVRRMNRPVSKPSSGAKSRSGSRSRPVSATSLAHTKTASKDHPHAGVISMKPPKPSSTHGSAHPTPAVSRTPSRQQGNFFSDEDVKPKGPSNTEKMDKILANFEHEKHNFVGAQHHATLHHLRDEDMDPDEYLSNDYIPIRAGLEARVRTTMNKYEAKFTNGPGSSSPGTFGSPPGASPGSSPIASPPKMAVMTRESSRRGFLSRDPSARSMDAHSTGDDSERHEHVVSREVKERNIDDIHKDEINHHMALFAKQRITQAELNEALAAATRKKGLEKMRVYGIHIRYGPYKTKDMFAFVRLLCSMEEARIQHLEKLESEMDEQDEGTQYGEGATFSTFVSKNKQAFNENKMLRTNSMLTNQQSEETTEQAKKSMSSGRGRRKKRVGVLQLFAERPQQEIVLEQLLAAPQVSCHYKLVRELEFLKKSDVPFTQTLITKGQLIPILFYHASEAET